MTMPQEIMGEIIVPHSNEGLPWPTPKPIRAELKPVNAFDADVLLPEALRGWIVDEAARMPCPPDYIAAAAIVALGSIIGARCAVKPKSLDSWLVVPNVWGGIVGSPSAKKSPAWGVAMKPLDRLIARAAEDYVAAADAHEVDKMAFEARADAIQCKIKEAAKKPSAGDVTALAQDFRDRKGNAPLAPIKRRYRTNDSTVERLGELLKENPNGILVLRDELVGLLAQWDKEGREGERAFFLEAWNGNQAFDTDRIGRGHISVANLCVSIFGGIQPDKLTGYLEEAIISLANDGMLQRFQMLVFPDPMNWEWINRLPNAPVRDIAYEIFDKLADFDPVEWGATPADDYAKFPWFRFDDAAQEIFIRWSTDLHMERMPNESEPVIEQHLAKFDKLFPALALIFHLVDCASTGGRGPIGKASAHRAAAWCEYLETHARRCYGLLTDSAYAAAQALAHHIERGELQDGFTGHEIRRHRWRRLTDKDTVRAALDWLEDEDWLKSESVGGTGPGTGKRTLRYSINPSIKGGSNGRLA